MFKSLIMMRQILKPKYIFQFFFHKKLPDTFLTISSFQHFDKTFVLGAKNTIRKSFLLENDIMFEIYIMKSAYRKKKYFLRIIVNLTKLIDV